ncbi:unnamed protein product [Scytosiphon promiscuus]
MEREIAGSDESVQATANDAALGKLSAASLGYFDDRFLEVLVGSDRTTDDRPVRRLPPVINRGNFARVSCIEKLVLDFVGATSKASSHHVQGNGGEINNDGACCDHPQSPIEQPLLRKPQVISLGAGKDSLYFRLMDGGTPPSGGYFEVDFPAVSTWKAESVAKAPMLSALVKDFYKLVATDLRDTAALEKTLRTAGADFSAPTIFLAECVMVYMEPAESAALLQWCASNFSDSMFAAYEMTSPHDAFGKMMTQNIQRMGCLLPGFKPYPTLSSQKERFLNAGWDLARAADMLQVFQSFLNPVEVRRISKIEVLDEVEEWELIMRHYCIVVAAKGQDGVTRVATMTPLSS